MRFPRIVGGQSIICTNCKVPREFKSLDGFKSHLVNYHGAKPGDMVKWVAPEENNDGSTAGPIDSNDNRDDRELPVP